MRFAYILSTLLICCSQVCLAQTGTAVAAHNDNKAGAGPRISEQPDNHARKLYERAHDYYREHEYEKACEAMKEALAVSPAYREAYSSLGEWYFRLRQPRL